MAMLKKPERDELRRQAKVMAIQMTRMTLPIDTVFALLDALDEQARTIQTLRELAPQPAPRDSEGKWQ